MRALATMSDQFNLYADEAATMTRWPSLRSAYLDSPERPMFNVEHLGEQSDRHASRTTTRRTRYLRCPLSPRRGRDFVPL